MEGILKRLQDLGLHLPPAPKAQGSYVPAVRTGNLVFVSGQLPMRDGQLVYKGKVGRDLDVEKAQDAARICFLNALAALVSISVDPDQVTRVVRLGGFVQCVDGFADQPKVVNGASDLCRAIFGEAGAHARAAVGVNALPLDAPVEIEALFEVFD
ncbi:MAG: putative endoribonuclease family [Fibrobacteres bacterium]|nr:putative endoribonuclease family [Fibrobacterota bacterium]